MVLRNGGVTNDVIAWITDDPSDDGSYFNSGQTVYIGDTLMVSFKARSKYAAISLPRLDCYLLWTDDQFNYNSDYLTTWNLPFDWTPISFGTKITTISGYGIIGVSFIAIESDTLDEVLVDDLRLYSSASQLPPAGRVQVDVYPQSESYYDVKYSVSDLAEDAIDIYLYYENPADGLYYDFTDNPIITGTAEDGDIVVEISSGAANALSTYGSIRVLPATKYDGYELHINEVDAIVLSE